MRRERIIFIDLSLVPPRTGCVGTDIERSQTIKEKNSSDHPHTNETGSGPERVPHRHGARLSPRSALPSSLRPSRPLPEPSCYRCAGADRDASGVLAGARFRLRVEPPGKLPRRTALARVGTRFVRRNAHPAQRKRLKFQRLFKGLDGSSVISCDRPSRRARCRFTASTRNSITARTWAS